MRVESTSFALMFRFNSENYQVMNYGLGGYISMHMDAYPDSNSINIGMGDAAT
jgi:hypothetical protein